MKLIYLEPAFDKLAASPDEMRPYLDALVDVIARALQPTGGEGIIGVWHEGEVGMEAQPFDAAYSGKRVKHLIYPGALRAVVRRIADPWDGYFMWVRCLTTCRWVRFGYDGQAFLCLRHEDVVPTPSDLIQVKDVSAILGETDVFDG